MSVLFGLIGALLWIVGGLGIIVFAFLAFINRNRSSASMFAGAGGLSFILLVIGIAVMTFSEENYWERNEMSESEKQDNEEIERNIQRNIQLEEEAFQNELEEQEKELEEAYFTSEEAVETPQQNHSVIDPLEEEKVYNLVVNYGNEMIQAINNGDFYMVESYLLPDSNFYRSQRELVDDLYSQNIVENLYMFNIESVRKTDINRFEVETYEEIGIEKEGKEEIKEFQWVYTVNYVNGEYLLSDIRGR
ncbi:TcaA NTF2-like domain-containing protein [Metabacillus sp. 113a]|uniref:TcaA NTF2-like domain-containing protein n=1 Tax=Metabacillus sp. 113a TaxID=3404706 RepID=UPI003CF9EB7F